MADPSLKIGAESGPAKSQAKKLRSRQFRLALFSFGLVAAEGMLLGGFFMASPWSGPAIAACLALLILLAGIGSLALSRYAVRPFRLARAALLELSQDRLSERLFYPEADDEPGQIFAAINRLLDRVEEAMDRQRRFVGGITHDIRTPLTIIKGDIEVALMQERTARSYREVLESNLEEVERIGKLVEDLLTLSRGNRGDLNLRVRGVHLDMLLREIRRKYQEAAAAMDITLSLYLEEEVAMEGDADRLRQVLVNLVENALHYTPAGGKIELALFKEENTARVLVRDTGVGIEPQDLPHVFEPFYRGAQQSNHQGYGLGLAICQHIVSAHAGAIRVESQVGPEGGTTFFITLPLRPQTHGASRVLAR
jgi:signal transduction histidine kinase